MLLAIDTSTQSVGLALFDGAQILGEMIWQTHNHHTVEIAPAVDDLLRHTGVKPTDLQALAVALGPGSFTSLRIGLAITKGLALSLHLPVVGVPSLDILAAGQPVSDLALAAVLQAGRRRLAVGWYAAVDHQWQSQGEAKVMTVEELAQEIQKPTLVSGELTAAGRQLLARKWKNVTLASAAQSVRRPAHLAELGWKRWAAGKQEDPVALAPIYLHFAEAIPE